jgi:hypothetical protein
MAKAPRHTWGGDRTRTNDCQLANGPSSQVTTWDAYDINGYTFYTKAKDNKTVSQNSGVHIENVDASGRVSTYYGFIQDIWELDYGSNVQIALFRCQWVKQPGSVDVNNSGLTCANLNNIVTEMTRGCWQIMWHMFSICKIHLIQINT